MNIAQIYAQGYRIDTDEYVFVRIIRNDKDAWYNSYNGQVFIAHKELHSGYYLYFPLTNELKKNETKSGGTPIITVDTGPEGQVVFGSILNKSIIYERPVNWSQYFKLKEASKH